MSWAKKKNIIGNKQKRNTQVFSYGRYIYINCYYSRQKVWKIDNINVVNVQFLPRHEYKEVINIINNESGHHEK